MDFSKYSNTSLKFILEENKETVNTFERLLKERIKDYQLIERELRRREAESRVRNQNSLDALRGEWAKNNLVVGDIVKVKGSRNTSPRRVLKIDKNGILTETVKLQRDPIDGYYKWISTHTITDHMFKKVVKIWVENTWFENIKEYLKDE